MRGGSRILARNNFAGRANPSRIFAGQARGGPMRGGLARFATPISTSQYFYYCYYCYFYLKELFIFRATNCLITLFLVTGSRSLSTVWITKIIAGVSTYLYLSIVKKIKIFTCQSKGNQWIQILKAMNTDPEGKHICRIKIGHLIGN